MVVFLSLFSSLSTLFFYMSIQERDVVPSHPLLNDLDVLLQCIIYPSSVHVVSRSLLFPGCYANIELLPIKLPQLTGWKDLPISAIIFNKFLYISSPAHSISWCSSETVSIFHSLSPSGQPANCPVPHGSCS